MKSTVKILLVLVVFSMVCMVSKAQDVVVLRDGSIINSHVTEINEGDIKYKKASNPDGPTYTISINKVLAINFENGDIERFENVVQSNDKNNESDLNAAEQAERVPDIADNNSELINKYNRLLEYKEQKEGKKQANKYLIKWGIMSNSILSNEDLEVTISFDTENGDYYKYVAPYVINIYNKTNDVLYVDLSNSYAVSSNGQSYPYFDSSEITTTQTGGGSGASVGLGSVAGALGVGGAVGTLASGISVGGGSSKSTITQYNPNAIITIPPKAKVFVSCNKIVKFKDGGLFNVDSFKFITVGESFNVPSEVQVEAPIEKGQTVYNESDTPYSLSYTFVYYLKSNPQLSSKINFVAYVQQLLGVNPVDSSSWPGWIRWGKYPRPRIGDTIPEDDKIGGNNNIPKTLAKIFKNYTSDYMILGK